MCATAACQRRNTGPGYDAIEAVLGLDDFSKLPPLRARPEDIAPLANYFLTKYSGKNLMDYRLY